MNRRPASCIGYILLDLRLWKDLKLIERPVAQYHPANDLSSRNTAEAARIEAIDPVIAHHKVMVGFDGYRATLAVAGGRNIVQVGFLKH